MNIRPIDILPKVLITDFFVKHWGSPKMVISSGIYQCDELDGFVVLDEDDQIIGVVTYYINRKECEIISLDSLVKNIGIGTALVHQVESVAKREQCTKIKMITTNDNISALGFYQKIGYSLSELYVNAVEVARKSKPEIPLIAENGIPIRDELLLVKTI